MTSSGIYVLFTEWRGGGSGRFRSLIFASVEQDKGLENFVAGMHALRFNRERWVIKKLGQLALGGRYEGNITLTGNTPRIGEDEHAKSPGFFKKDVVLELGHASFPRAGHLAASRKPYLAGLAYNTGAQTDVRR